MKLHDIFSEVVGFGLLFLNRWRKRLDGELASAGLPGRQPLNWSWWWRC